MPIVINNAVLEKRLVSRKFIYIRKNLLDYLKANKLLYLKSPLNKLLNHKGVSNDYINSILKRSKKLAKKDFVEFLLEKFSYLNIEVNSRVKENSETINNRQKRFKEKQKETSQLLQFYIKKDIFENLEDIRNKKHLSKQDFYSNALKEYLAIIS